MAPRRRRARAGRRAGAPLPEIRVRVAGALVRPYRDHRALARVVSVSSDVMRATSSLVFQIRATVQ